MTPLGASRRDSLWIVFRIKGSRAEEIGIVRAKDAAGAVLNHTKPTLTVSHVSFFDVWTAIVAELAGYYGKDAESFHTSDASWNDDDQYADGVTLNGRIVGALDRPLTQEDVATIFGVNRMEKRASIELQFV
jgi:hypothetical protein